MEITFKEPKLADLYEGKKVKDKRFRFQPELIRQFIKTVKKLQSVEKLEQLFQYAGLNYEKLRGDLKGYSSVRINQQYRLIFQEITSESEPFEVEILAIEEISKHYE